MVTVNRKNITSLPHPLGVLRAQLHNLLRARVGERSGPMQGRPTSSELEQILRSEDNSKVDLPMVAFLSSSMRQAIHKEATNRHQLQFSKAKCPCTASKMQQAWEATSHQLRRILLEEAPLRLEEVEELVG